MAGEQMKQQESISIMDPGSPDIKYKSGLTLRTFMAIIYTAVVFLPASVWMTLAMGNADIMWWTISYTTVLLFSEVLRFLGAPLSKQELYVIWSCAAVSGAAVYGTNFVFSLYYRNVSQFTLISTAPGTDIPLRHLIPDWWAPPPTSTAILQRTLVHPDFMLPILIVYSSLAFGIMSNIGLGFLTYGLYVKTEKLRFPLHRVSAEMVVTVASREPRKMAVMVGSAVIGLFYGVMLFGFPFASNFAVTPIPIPWLEVSMDQILPGATFGFATDLFQIAVGFILPFNVVLSMFIGSFAVYFVGNSVLVHLFPPVGERLGGLFGYAAGMHIRDVWQMSMLRVWASPVIGVTLAAALIPLALHWRQVSRAVTSSLRAVTSKGVAARSTLLPVALWLGGIIPLIAIPIMLVPNFPAWIFIILGLGVPLLGSIVAGRGLGETGYAVGIPYLREGVYLASGYQGIDVWYAPPAVQTGFVMYNESGGGGICASLAVADMTETSHKSWLITYIVATTLSVVLSFFYVDAFWRMSPIPSSAYPGTVIFWPINVLNSVVWVGRSQISWAPTNIAIAFGIASAATLACHFLKIPFSIVGLAFGVGQPIPANLSLLVGGTVNIFLTRRYGKRWTDYRVISVAGLALGEGIVASIGSIVALIRNSTWALPY